MANCSLFFQPLTRRVAAHHDDESDARNVRTVVVLEMTRAVRSRGDVRPVSRNQQIEHQFVSSILRTWAKTSDQGQ